MISYYDRIQQSGLSIYDPIDPMNDWLYIPSEELEAILARGLIGLSLEGLPLRTRSKVVKENICRTLGYPIPASFKKTQPRFPGQNFDVYTQKSMNVQIWNEEVDPTRRYVFLQANENDVIINVRVVSGAVLAQFDRTGTLTQKYQARMQSYGHNICSQSDTESVRSWVAPRTTSLRNVDPNYFPRRNELLLIDELFHCLEPLVGRTIHYLDAVQERNRGAELHELICKSLGYSYYSDDGSYPDIANQLLEIKLQTSPTIDLGLHSPEDGLPVIALEGTTFFSQDIRYAIFEGIVHGEFVTLKNLYLVTGEDFSYFFPLFKGKGTNKKIQLPLPYDFFNN